MWAVGHSLNLPIFEGGKLRAGLRLAKASYDETVANYGQTVLTAFSEVEDNLADQNLLAKQYEAENGALIAARLQLQIANNRYRDGLTTYLDVATAESTELNVDFSTIAINNNIGTIEYSPHPVPLPIAARRGEGVNF
jgi:multidrug efflux system outer membrane protein